MEAKIRLEFKGSLSELYEYLEEHFTELNNIYVDFTTEVNFKYEILIEKSLEALFTAETMSKSFSECRENLLYVFPRLEKYLKANQRINAIKEYRAQTGSSLKTAKDIVEGILLPSYGFN